MAAAEAVDEKYRAYDVLVAFDRQFISNPDFVFRLKAGVGLAPYNRDTFYIPKSPVGYINSPFSSEFLAKAEEPDRKCYDYDLLGTG